MTRKEILNTAEKYVCQDRNEQYSEPENSFVNIANLWNDFLHAKYKFKGIMPEDVGILMTLLKIGRMASGNKEDNYIDVAGYIACAGEIATKPHYHYNLEPWRKVMQERQAKHTPTPTVGTYYLSETGLRLNIWTCCRCGKRVEVGKDIIGDTLSWRNYFDNLCSCGKSKEQAEEMAKFWENK